MEQPERRWICNECDWKGAESQLLRAPNPFDLSDSIVGCPDCKAPNTMLVACDEHGCWQRVTCGTPTPTGYRSTCSKHKPNPLYYLAQTNGDLS